VYGLGAQPDRGPLRFREICERTYVEDLAGCSAYVGAAGNQTLGELLYFGKPVLALPEAKHHEQRINSHFVRQMRVGDFVRLHLFEDSSLRDFLDRLDEFRAALRPLAGQLDGTPAALEVVRRFLPKPVAAIEPQPSPRKR
jgi:uncharacterized protein (TIGR00661 family)